MNLTIAYLLARDLWPAPKAKGYARQWLECHQCGFLQYYDYIPYSLSTPIMVSDCGHDLDRMKRLGKPPQHLHKGDESCTHSKEK